MSMPHIEAELEDVYKKGTHIVDGELYNHSYKTNFEAITSLIRQEEPAENCTEVQFHVYDKAMPGGFANRIQTLTNELHAYEKAVAPLQYIVPVQTVTAEDEDELMDLFENFLSLGYEGAMVRNVDGEYVNKRSYDLQKIKEFDDAEFEIIGIEEGRGKLMGHAAKFICKMPSGLEFRAKLKGDTSKLKEFFEDSSLWEGKIVTVKYQGITKYGIPRFPVAERLREDV
jgi:ATP-dependent DNA ligase